MNKYSASVVGSHSHSVAGAISTAGIFCLAGAFQGHAVEIDVRGRSAGKSVAMIFQKPSLRTRVTFEVAIRQLGGWPVLLGPAESQLGEREAIQDVARNLSLWVDAIVARVFAHRHLLANVLCLDTGDQCAQRR